MRKPILIALTVAIVATVILLTCQGGDTSDVEPMADRFIRDSVQIRVGDELQWVQIRIGVSSRVPVFSADPSPIGIGVSREVFERRFRWAQILVDVPTSDPSDLPRFDIGTTEREAAAAPADDPGRVAREGRTSHHDPFQRTNPTFPPYRFHDSPTATRWDAYVILFEITESATTWRASIVKVWHWTFDSTRDPRNQVVPTDIANDDFQDALDKAMAEFGGAFAPGRPNPLPLPPRPVAPVR
jgi:hypothetical protein